MPHAAGLRTAVDVMPTDCGRNPAKLAELSRRTGVHLVAATGLHHERFYGPSHWSLRATEDELADLFVADIEDGIDARRRPRAGRPADRAPGRGRQGRRQRRRPVGPRPAGLPRRGRSPTGGPASRPHPLRGRHGRPRAAPRPDRRRGPAEHVSLSHVDKVVDRAYHRDSFASGAFVVYDQAFRWGDRPNGTLQLLDWAAEDGHLDRVMLGMDAARQGYYRAFGGAPGLDYLLRDFREAMDARGLDAAIRHRLFVDNPARAFAFTEVRP